MIDYEEMNRVLGQADREFAAMARRDRKEETAPEEQQAELPVEVDHSYIASMEVHRRIKEHIERLKAGVDEEYAEVKAANGSVNKELGGAVYGLALHTIVFPVIAWYFMTIHILITIGLGIVGIFWVFATIRFVKKVLNRYMTHLVMKSDPGTKAFAKEFNIPTYGAKIEKCEKRLQLLQDRLIELETYELKIERQQGLLHEEFEAMQTLREVPRETETFSDKTEVTFLEFWKWKRQQKSRGEAK